MDIFVLSSYQTKFGELWDQSLTDLIDKTLSSLFKNCSLTPRQIDIAFLSNMLAQSTHNQGHLASYLTSKLNLNIPSIRIESACASGAVAVFNAINFLKTNRFKTALILGVEKMTDNTSSQIGSFLLQAGSSDLEGRFGLTFPGLYALIARAYIEKYRLTRRQLSAVSVKNHQNGFLNPNAHFQKKVTLNQVSKSPLIAAPLRLLDCSPISDGAAALILTTDKKLASENKPLVRFLASEMATDSLSLQERSSFSSLKATKIAAKKAFKSAKITPRHINFAEVHDCFTIAEIIALEDIGFYKKGTAKKAALNKETTLNGPLPVNPSGGLKSAGHPVGATGIKQIIEAALQLQNKALKRQLKKPQFALTHNIGGSGATCVINILTNN